MPTRRDILALLAVGVARAHASSAAQLIDNSKVGNPPRRPVPPGKGPVIPALDSSGKVFDSWWSSLPLNQWVEVSGTDPKSGITPLLPAGFRDWGNGLGGFFYSWTGAAFDRATGRMWFTGGGHYDSSNNGMYEFALEKMTWRTSMSPTIISAADLAASKASWIAGKGSWGGFNQGYTYPNDWNLDGKPTAQHSYASIVWCPQNNKVIRCRGSRIWQIDPVNGSFTKGIAVGGQSDSSATYDSVTQKVHGFFWDSMGWTNYRAYDPIADTISAKLNLGMPSSWLLPLIVGRKIYCYQDSVAKDIVPKMKTVDLDSGIITDLPLINPPVRGLSWYSTGDYSPKLNKIYSMHRSNSSFTTIDPETGECGTYTPAGTPPLIPAGVQPNAPYSKFRIYERANGTFMVLFHIVDANLRIVRIA